VQRLRRATKPLKAGDQLHIYYDEEVLATVPPTPKLIADEGDYSIWHKP
jgi:tRNA pseudouridine32 synthase/23S rRNA pseudouridine746 synthase